MSGETMRVHSQASQDEDDSPMEPVDDDDVWDDSLLIKAYNKAVDMAKEKIAKKISLENGTNANLKPAGGKASPPKKKSGKNKNSSQKTTIGWTVGMPCRAVYSVDGLEYEATISSVDSSTGTCVVVYYGYNNEEEVDISSLKPSRGENARSAQEYESMHDAQAANGEALGVIPPPPPPNVMAHFPKDESDALSAMLMAWYMSGYHTGYYQGLARSKMARTNGHPNSARPN